MEDNIQEVSSTEVEPQHEMAEISIRQALSKQLKQIEQTESNAEADEKTEEVVQESAPTEVQPPPVERIPLAPPADMNKAEREAFLNPTTDNSHILQSYLNRRAYEQRSDYGRKMQEVESLRQQNQSIYDVIKEHQDEYAKMGIGVHDAVRSSIAWDRAMRANPVQTALEYLNAYGVHVEDLTAFYEHNRQTPQNYLTKEEAERIAEDRIKSMMADQQKMAVEYMNQRVVESFISQKPLFRDPETASQLEAEMAPVVEALSKTGRYSSPDQILETAYNYVVNGNPTFSGLNQKLTAKPIVEQQQAAVQKAKQAAKSITGSAGSGSPRIVTKDIRDNLRRRMTG